MKIKKFNDMKIRSKLIISFIVVVIVPVMIVGVFLTNQLREMALNNAIEQITIDMDRVKKRTAEVLIPPIYVSNHALLDQRLKDLVNTAYQSTYEVVHAYNHYSDFRNHIRYYPEISNIRFYYNNPTMLNNWTFIPISDEVAQTSWYKRASDGKGLIGWYYTEDEMRGRKNLSLIRAINYQSLRSTGMLVIDINTEQLNWILSQEMTPTMIVDSQNHIVAAKNREHIGLNLTEIEFPRAIIEGDVGVFEAPIFDEPSQIMVDKLVVDNSINELRIISVISNATINKDANQISLLGMVIVSLGLIVALVLIYWFSHLLSKRLSTLRSQIDVVAQGNLQTNEVIEGNDEIGQLSKKFHDMTVSIKNLLHVVEEKNEEKRKLEKHQSEIKLKMLASQINPHFLFNTLETIRMKAHMRGESDISQVVKRLGKLLRRSLEVGGEMITIKKEVDMVTSYLEIQNFRFEHRLLYEIHLDPLVENVHIPPLVIQPLVENAVIHGLGRESEGGKVTVTVSKEEDKVLVQVLDNGIGMTEEKRAVIIASLSSTEDNEHRIGIRNVHERMILKFGSNSGLHIHSEYGKGTCVYFYLPLLNQKEEFDV
ncbi:cache domain-containing sensor histidine kinase [Halalkalibacter urbisdiaboli]|uniref:cache domain-containing sensor histidine kinase n=1 Tax=Halalkalibacter urbisdiaboli TaxID=1960589 RepID=UPI000B4437F2|nr:sensor histidine kinase [Halalkalibacter urbisdiaboli]